MKRARPVRAATTTGASLIAQLPDDVLLVLFDEVVTQSGPYLPLCTNKQQREEAQKGPRRPYNGSPFQPLYLQLARVSQRWNRLTKTLHSLDVCIHDVCELGHAPIVTPNDVARRDAYSKLRQDIWRLSCPCGPHCHGFQLNVAFSIIFDLQVLWKVIDEADQPDVVQASLGVLKDHDLFDTSLALRRSAHRDGKPHAYSIDSHYGPPKSAPLEDLFIAVPHDGVLLHLPLWELRHLMARKNGTLVTSRTQYAVLHLSDGRPLMPPGYKRGRLELGRKERRLHDHRRDCTPWRSFYSLSEEGRADFLVQHRDKIVEILLSPIKLCRLPDKRQTLVGLWRAMDQCNLAYEQDCRVLHRFFSLLRDCAMQLAPTTGHVQYLQLPRQADDRLCGFCPRL